MRVFGSLLFGGRHALRVSDGNWTGLPQIVPGHGLIQLVHASQAGGGRTQSAHLYKTGVNISWVSNYAGSGVHRARTVQCTKQGAIYHVPISKICVCTHQGWICQLFLNTKHNNITINISYTFNPFTNKRMLTIKAWLVELERPRATVKPAIFILSKNLKKICKCICWSCE